MNNTENATLNMSPEQECVFRLIERHHAYFSKQDKKYRRRVRIFKILTLLCAMISTIVLGLKDVMSNDFQVNFGLVLSALLTFLTSISAYFHYEEYWMRNITIHINLNILRDNFVFDAKSGALDDKLLEEYRNKLEELQKDNIGYWEKAIKKI